MSHLMEEVTDWVYGGFRPYPLSISNSRFCWAYQPKQQQLTTADEFPGRGLPPVAVLDPSLVTWNCKWKSGCLPARHQGIVGLPRYLHMTV